MINKISKSKSRTHNLTKNVKNTPQSFKKSNNTLGEDRYINGSYDLGESNGSFELEKFDLKENEPKVSELKDDEVIQNDNLENDLSVTEKINLAFEKLVEIKSSIINALGKVDKVDSPNVSLIEPDNIFKITGDYSILNFEFSISLENESVDNIKLTLGNVTFFGGDMPKIEQKIKSSFGEYLLKELQKTGFDKINQVNSNEMII